MKTFNRYCKTSPQNHRFGHYTCQLASIYGKWIFAAILLVLTANSYAVNCGNTPETGNSSADYMWGHVATSDAICYANQFQNSNSYNNMATNSFDISWRFALLFPDAAPIDGASNPAKAIFLPSGGTSRSTISTATCVGGNVTGVGTKLVSIELADGASCDLRMVSNNGSADITYTGTIHRTGSVYWATGASLTGGAFGLPDTTSPRVSSIVRFNPSTYFTSADTLTWRVSFDEAVSNVDATDFSRSGTTATLSVNAVNSLWYDVTLAGGDLAELNGSVVLSFSATQNITDIVGNPLTNTTPTGSNSPSYFVQNLPEIDVQRPNGTSIPDGSTDNQGNHTIGNQVTLNYTVHNTGNAALNVTNIAAINANNVSVDSVSPTNLVGIAPGSSAAFTVKYTNSATAAFSFDLDLTNNDADESNYDISVSGTGVENAVANAGVDHLVSPETEAVVLGGTPSAVSGTPPFTYAWSISPGTLGIDYSLSSASASNPTFIGYSDNLYTATLTLTDALSSMDTDSSLLEVTFPDSRLVNVPTLDGTAEYSACQEIVVEGTTIVDGANISLVAPVVTIAPGFTVEPLAIFSVVIATPMGCGP